MELQPNENTIIIPHEEYADIVQFDFVSELLARTLAGQNDEVIFSPEDFINAPGTGIETTASLKVELEGEDVVVAEDEIEITLFGTVKNEQGRKEIFTLYCFIQLNRKIDISMMNCYKRNLLTNSLVIQFEDEEEELNDSVFELSLYQKNPSDLQYELGQGKGFLFVGQD
jgi:hypothetical protein